MNTISISALRPGRQAPRPAACNALLVYPRFSPNSFWNYQATCEIVGAKYPAAPLGLITVAALLPQQRDAFGVIAAAYAANKPVVVGGPDATSSPHVYADADFQVLGEAEDILADFLHAWVAGADRGVFQAKGFPDVATSPMP